MIGQADHFTNYRTLKVFFGGIPLIWENEQVAEVMHRFGRVVGVEIKREANGYSKGYGFVHLEEYVDPRKIYGKHQFKDSFFEIKELKQKHLYISFAGTIHKVSEALIAQTFFDQGHHVEAIEIGGKATQCLDYLAKITFVEDSSAKYFLSRKYVNIEQTAYNVFSSIDCQKHKLNSNSHKNNKGKPYNQSNIDYGNNKRYKNNYNYGPHSQEDVNMTEEVTKNENPKSKKHNNKITNDTILKTTLNQEIQIECDKVAVQQKQTGVQSNTQSTDDQKSIGRLKASESDKPSRKLSYKGKDLEFHPSYPLEDISELLIAESSPLSTDFISEISAPSKDQLSSMSKLSSSSVDWKLENLMMWPQAGYNQQMLYSLYSQLPAATPYYSSLRKASDWTSPKDSVFEPPKKKEIKIEFFTFPGVV